MKRSQLSAIRARLDRLGATLGGGCPACREDAAQPVLLWKDSPTDTADDDGQRVCSRCRRAYERPVFVLGWADTEAAAV